MLRFFEWLTEKFAVAAETGLTRGTGRFVSKVSNGQILLIEEESPPEDEVLNVESTPKRKRVFKKKRRK